MQLLIQLLSHFTSNRTCKTAAISARFQSDIAVRFLRNPTNLHHAQTCSKILQYWGDRSRSNRRWFTHAIENRNLSATKVTLKMYDNNRTCKRAFMAHNFSTMIYPNLKNFLFLGFEIFSLNHYYLYIFRRSLDACRY